MHVYLIWKRSKPNVMLHCESDILYNIRSAVNFIGSDPYGNLLNLKSCGYVQNGSEWTVQTFESIRSLHRRPSQSIHRSFASLLMMSHLPSPETGFCAPSVSLDKTQSMSSGSVSDTNHGNLFTLSRTFVAKPKVTRKSENNEGFTFILKQRRPPRMAE